jgi:hypothetical protein
MASVSPHGPLITRTIRLSGHGEGEYRFSVVLALPAQSTGNVGGNVQNRGNSRGCAWPQQITQFNLDR